MDPRFSCVVMQTRPIDELRESWRIVEEAGFSTIWLLDHLMTFPKMGTPLEAYATLGALAASTERIRIGTLVTNITYRNPAFTARQAVTLDHLSAGRFDLGIGAAGSRRDDARVPGIDEWSVAERADRFEEFVACVDALLGGAESFAGKYYRSEAFDSGPYPVQPRVPLTIAAQGPRTLRVAARYADRWNALAGFGRSGEELLSFLRDCNSQIDELSEGFGRRPSDIKRSVLVHDSGFPWWESRDALDDFLGTLTEAGIEEFVFYYPPYGDAAGAIDPAAFVELLHHV